MNTNGRSLGHAPVQQLRVMCVHTHTHTHTHTHHMSARYNTQTHRHTETHRHRHTHMHTDTLTHTQTHKLRKREREWGGRVVGDGWGGRGGGGAERDPHLPERGAGGRLSVISRSSRFAVCWVVEALVCVCV
jgi:hypothetical protein